jgi:hypothetical protein
MIRIPVAYWKKLDAILRERVPILYNFDVGVLPKISFTLSQQQMATASMSLNNVKLFPKDSEAELPVPNQDKYYGEYIFFIQPVTF